MVEIVDILAESGVPKRVPRIDHERARQDAAHRVTADYRPVARLVTIFGIEQIMDLLDGRAQLSGLLHYLHRARERIGQARSQLRQRQAERAYRRATAGLSNLKRARDQLRDPVQVLDGVILDTVRLTRETRALAAVQLGLVLGSDADPVIAPVPVAPAWLNSPYLSETQDEVGERTEELDARFVAGLSPAGESEDPQHRALLEQVGEAQPHVAAASEHFAGAGEALEADRPNDAVELLAAALTELIHARERFLDLKRLIEVAYEDEKRIVGFVSSEAGIGAEQIAELGPALSRVQEQNLERLRRMEPMVERERTNVQLELAAAEESEDEGGAGQQALERFELADGILAMTEPAMTAAIEALAVLGSNEAATTRVREHVATAMRGLEALRRLFFSIVEHIRDAAQRQVELGDQTEEAMSREPDDRGTILGPLSSHQEELAQHTDSLAAALHPQSLTYPAAVLGPDPAAHDAAAAEATEKLIQASELVLYAGAEMAGAAQGLGAAPHDFEAIRQHQTTAIEQLAQALALLQPPQQQQQDPQEQGDSEQQQEQQKQGQQAPQENEQQQDSDPAQLLQSVRDREAERHRRQGEREPRGQEPVEKDW